MYYPFPRYIKLVILFSNRTILHIHLNPKAGQYIVERRLRNGRTGGARREKRMDSHLEPLLLLMIVTPHPVHTHSRSSLYIYKLFEHLQQWLRVIRE